MKEDPRKDPVLLATRSLAVSLRTGPQVPRKLGTSLGTGPGG
jgi:hypothetical protein